MSDDIYVIRQVHDSELERCVSVIRDSFAHIAKRFNLTKENCPTHTSFITLQNLQYHRDNGFLMFGLYLKDAVVGYVSLEDIGDAIYKIHNLAVLPGHRHKGCGKQLLDFCKATVRELSGKKIVLDFIEDNTVLKNWYFANDFVHTGTSTSEKLPFTRGNMEYNIL